MKEKVKITGVPETMIQTLYARAKETQKNNAKIKDDIAVGIVEKLDYDFSKADNDKTMASGVIARTIVLDKMVGNIWILILIRLLSILAVEWTQDVIVCRENISTGTILICQKQLR